MIEYGREGVMSAKKNDRDEVVWRKSVSVCECLCAGERGIQRKTTNLSLHQFLNNSLTCRPHDSKCNSMENFCRQHPHGIY